MKAAFLLGLAAGLLGATAAAHYYPWVDHPRLASKTTVVQNGGRAEAFLIRLPADRLVATGTHSAGQRAVPYPAGNESTSLARAEPLLVEHFKLRDTDGQVIGLAARHWTAAESGPVAAWSLVIPSRGALLLAGTGEAPGALDGALRRAGQVEGARWNGEVALPVASLEDGASVIVGGSQEFANLNGRYGETWRITGVDENGEASGTIELSTVTYRER